MHHQGDEDLHQAMHKLHICTYAGTNSNPYPYCMQSVQVQSQLFSMYLHLATAARAELVDQLT